MSPQRAHPKILNKIPTGLTYSEVIDGLSDDLNTLNQKIYTNPELGYEEFQAHDNISDLLETLGFNVTRHAYGLATSFEAVYGSGGRLVTFNAEYDALPGIGHACAHNLLATCSIAAFLGAAYALREAPDGTQGRVRILGTPAEEGGGGKIKLIEAGAFKDTDACLLCHPGPTGRRGSNTAASAALLLATGRLSVTFTGKAAHAAMSPWQGKNALDAAVLAYNALSMLRQQLAPSEKLHSFISNGGNKTNVIPNKTSIVVQFRASTKAIVQSLQTRVEDCVRGAAIATGCTISIEPEVSYADMRINGPICTEFSASMGKMGIRTFGTAEKPLPLQVSGDQGNVSYECPAFHGGFDIPSNGHFPHTPGFEKAAGTEAGFRATLVAAKGMSSVGLRVLQDDEFAVSVKQDFERDCALRAEEEAARRAQL
ncbi:hypothetical protein NA57DRAFT_73880 [Rhizodiscina lignyota]|uniref:Peptidase M20 domain-containing protein 2 n=1 Tax=Rhizodiscina lignyota TaxID=1504668 RepID=A0A9P4MC26_9PEZI|nr:hypothetical protein NA57DRAFT_73880 [Rhizodiscina lignyota]